MSLLTGNMIINVLKKFTLKNCRDKKGIIFQLFKQLEADIYICILTHVNACKSRKKLTLKIFLRRFFFLKQISPNVNSADGES